MRFVFVHGGFHAGWCWSHTVAELEKIGHTGIAIDLPGHGTRLDEESTLTNRRKAVAAVLQPGDVLVGHSGGGFDATLGADSAPELVSHIVYLAAALPREGRSYTDAMTMGSEGAEFFDTAAADMLSHLHFADDGAMTFADIDGARQYFYHDCDDETVRWAFDGSVRNVSARPRWRRCRYRTFGRPISAAASFAANRIAPTRAGWPSWSASDSVWNR